MDNNQKNLCVICPCYNETEVLKLFYQALKPVLRSLPNLVHEIIFVDDGSTDDTLEQLNHLAASDESVTVLSLSRNFGHQIALTAGLDAADGDAVLMMDSDLQHPPSVIPKMVHHWQADGYDIVSAVRQRTADATYLKKLTSEWFYLLINKLSSTRIEPGAADFCLLSKRAYQALTQMPERHRFLRGMIAWIGFRRIFVPYEAAPRAAGHSKYDLGKMMVLALNAALSFSATPIRFATRFGMVCLLVGFGYLGYVIWQAFWLKNTEPGWGSLMSVLLIFGGMQFMLTGMIGNYLGGVFEEVKGRPLYFLKQNRNNQPHHPVVNRFTPVISKDLKMQNRPLEPQKEEVQTYSHAQKKEDNQ